MTTMNHIGIYMLSALNNRNPYNIRTQRRYLSADGKGAFLRSSFVRDRI